MYFPVNPTVTLYEVPRGVHYMDLLKWCLLYLGSLVSMALSDIPA